MRTSPEKPVSIAATSRLTSVTISVIKRTNQARPKGRRPVMPAGRGECGARGRGLISCAPGRLGHHACRHYDRRARCFAGLGQAGAGVMPASTAQGLRPPVGAGVQDRALRPSPRKPGPKLSLRDDDSLWREPWWNAGRRARPQAEGGASRLSVARPARRLHAGLGLLRLPAFRFPFFFRPFFRHCRT